MPSIKAFRHTAGQLERIFHGRRIRQPLAGDVISRTVGRGGNRDRQSTMDGDAALEAHELHRDLTLIVVHRHDTIEALPVLANGPHKRRVGRERTIGRKPLGGGEPHAGRDDAAFLIAKITVIAVMWIQPSDRDPRCSLARRPQGLGNHDNRLGYFLDAQQRTDVAQRYMRRYS